MDFKTILPNHELRARARQQLKGAWGIMALAMFVYMLIAIVPQFLFWEHSPLHNVFLDPLMSLSVAAISGPMALGIAGFYLKRIRGMEISVGNIFDGFQRFLPAFLLAFLSGLFVMLWSLLFVIPGIIKAFGYSMAYFIMHDNPDIRPREALKKSEAMMKGHKFRYFALQLSFIGWYLLGILSLGIGYIWLSPYVYLAMGNFYENLKAGQEKPAEQIVEQVVERATEQVVEQKPKTSGLDADTWKIR